jgi:hypothetical protein
MTADVKPILVCMVWRGGKRFERCLKSIQQARHHFSRVIISVTGPIDGADMHLAHLAQEQDSSVEVICTGIELPTMQHQAFWVTYLETTQARPDEWIYWLAYDDEVRLTGLNAITGGGSWPLVTGTAYFGPWALRHESPDLLWAGDPTADLESWTSFPQQGPTELPVETWITNQLSQPTYMQMSGSVNPLQAFTSLKNKHPRKRGPMRIEMAIAAQPCTRMVAEFSEPVSIIYGRADSDRASYGRAARWEDLHLLGLLTKRSFANKGERNHYVNFFSRNLSSLGQASEEWRVRDHVAP